MYPLIPIESLAGMIELAMAFVSLIVAMLSLFVTRGA